jgi:hypothetical protein
MGVITFRHQGNFKNVEGFFKGYNSRKLVDILEKYGEEGVRALSSATPKDTGLTASSWSYRTSISKGSFFIIWENSNLTSSGTPIVILLQYGYGTRDGGYVQGQDFINPVIRPIMNKIADAVWREVTG